MNFQKQARRLGGVPEISKCHPTDRGQDQISITPPLYARRPVLTVLVDVMGKWLPEDIRVGKREASPNCIQWLLGPSARTTVDPAGPQGGT